MFAKIIATPKPIAIENNPRYGVREIVIQKQKTSSPKASKIKIRRRKTFIKRSGKDIKFNSNH